MLFNKRGSLEHILDIDHNRDVWNGVAKILSIYIKFYEFIFTILKCLVYELSCCEWFLLYRYLIIDKNIYWNNVQIRLEVKVVFIIVFFGLPTSQYVLYLIFLIFKLVLSLMSLFSFLYIMFLVFGLFLDVLWNTHTTLLWCLQGK